MKIKKSELKILIKECLNESQKGPRFALATDDQETWWFVKGTKLVTFINKDGHKAAKFVATHNKYFKEKLGTGNLYICHINEKDEKHINKDNIIQYIIDYDKVSV